MRGRLCCEAHAFVEPWEMLVPPLVPSSHAPLLPPLVEKHYVASAQLLWRARIGHLVLPASSQASRFSAPLAPAACVPEDSGDRLIRRSCSGDGGISHLRRIIERIVERRGTGGGGGGTMMRKVVRRAEWEARMDAAAVRAEDMNKLVMNYLVTEGYVDAARKFEIESGTNPGADLGAVAERMAVKQAVQQIGHQIGRGPGGGGGAHGSEAGGAAGDVEDAIDRVNDLNPEILDTGAGVFFRLQQQRLIELIRAGRVDEALEFAQEELAPRGEENAAYLEELERTVALLAFEDPATSAPATLTELLDVSQRDKAAAELNAAILASQGHEKDPKLPSVLRMLLWLQGQLDGRVSYPKVTDLTTAVLHDPPAL
ncbi:unnamed protein product [Closterium sp. Yama58-4]|nr:unnamed protein product [Closterium sp. Yama58-4]